MAWRVLHPRLPVNPGFIRFDSALPAGPVRCFYVNVVSLLPGTVACGFEGDQIVIHALDRSTGVEPALRTLEQRIAGLLVWEKEGGP